MELVDGINVMFGNPNSADVESQPYILVIGRDTVASLKWEAERYSKNKDKYGKDDLESWGRKASVATAKRTNRELQQQADDFINTVFAGVIESPDYERKAQEGITS